MAFNTMGGYSFDEDQNDDTLEYMRPAQDYSTNRQK